MAWLAYLLVADGHRALAFHYQRWHSASHTSPPNTLLTFAVQAMATRLYPPLTLPPTTYHTYTPTHTHPHHTTTASPHTTACTAHHYPARAVC